jgi:hypothetical protein
MCVLHVTSETGSFSGFLRTTSLPVYRSHEKGDISSHGKRLAAEDYGFSCKVSEKEWTDLSGQIEDAHKFLSSHLDELRALAKSQPVTDIRFDFPYECRLDSQFFTQCDFLPAKFLRLSGELGIGIELSHYPKQAQD